MRVLMLFSLCFGGALTQEDEACTPLVEDAPQISGDAFLQHNSQKSTLGDSRESGNTQLVSKCGSLHSSYQGAPTCIPDESAQQFMFLATASKTVSRRSIGGAEAALDSIGFKETTSMCCPAEMEIFFGRLLDSLGYYICSYRHVQGLMHWFTCVPEMDFEYVLTIIANGNPCKYWAPKGQTCPTLSPECAGTWCEGPTAAPTTPPMPPPPPSPPPPPPPSPPRRRSSPRRRRAPFQPFDLLPRTTRRRSCPYSRSASTFDRNASDRGELDQCAPGCEFTSAQDCKKAIDEINAAIQKNGSNSVEVKTVRYSFKPPGCSASCKSDYSGHFCAYFNTHPKGSAPSTDEHFVFCKQSCDARKAAASVRQGKPEPEDEVEVQKAQAQAEKAEEDEKVDVRKQASKDLLVR